MSEPHLLAIDAGTSSVRAVVFDADGHLQAEVRRPCSLELREGEIVEQDPQGLWEAVCAVVRQAVGQAPGPIVGMGVAGVLSLVLADAEGAPLRPAMIWQDRRARAELGALLERVDAVTLAGTSARRPDPEHTACRLLWLQRHEPDVLARAAHAYSLKDWLVHRLTGAAATDRTSASYTLLYDVREDRWVEALLAELALPPRLFPPVYPADRVAGRLTDAAAAALGIPGGTPVVVGGPDGSMGALGAGMVAPGIAVNVIGTTDVLFAGTAAPQVDPSGRTVLNAFVVPGLWAVGGPMGLTGGAVSWLGELLEEPAPYAALDAAAQSVPPGAEGLLFVPFLSGDRMPRWNQATRGTICGLTPRHGRGHLMRALLEGCAYEVAQALDAIEAAAGAVRTLRAAGGGTGSALWLAIRASVLGRPLQVPQEREATALGTAMAAGVGTGLYRDFTEAAQRCVRIRGTVAADPAMQRSYAAERQRYERFRTQLDPLFADSQASR